MQTTKATLLGAVLSLAFIPHILSPGVAQADSRWNCKGNNGNHYGQIKHNPNYGSGYFYGGRPNYNYGHPTNYDYGSYDYGRRPYTPNVYGVNDGAIQRGIWSGQLTSREARDLQEDQWKIRRETAAYWADGRLSPSERDDLRGDIEEYNNQLNHNLHDGERRGYGW